ncbi:MAG: alpha-L-fucosidase [Pirellulales bacterium]|nr:alpha-L-fucosidase [Pirellulales bacterium]
MLYLPSLSRPLGVLLLSCFVAGGFAALDARTVHAALPGESKEATDQRMAWWRDAKFGMFIHWGLYAIPAGEWKGRKVPGIGEWIMDRGHIPVQEYAPLQKQFNPVKFDAAKWVGIAKRAGMKYIVITSKHHDGFCLFDSKLTDYDVMGAPFQRDIMKELADECHKQGIQICWYHSIMDWYQPDAKGANFPKYAEHLRGQLKELLTNYGKIGVLWFDGEWIGEWTEEQGRELEKTIRDLQPQLIVNNRIGKRKRSPGDFGTPEQEIPATGMPGWDWETCMTMNDTWGFKKDDHNWKSTDDIIRKLVDIVSKGGNFLLNVGPTAEGVIPQPSVERLAAVGKWLEVNGESIYGTGASPFSRLAWGRCTQKPGRLYLHVFEWPTEGQLAVRGLGNSVNKAYLLADADRAALEVAATDDSLSIRLPAKAPDPIDSVIVLEIEGEPNVTNPAITQSSGNALTLHARDASTHGERIRYESGSGKDNLGFWTSPEDWADWVLRITKPGTFEVEVTYACPNVSAGSEYVIEVAGTRLAGKVQGTGSWTQFKTEKLGTVKLPADRLTLSVKAKNLVGEGVMNLQSIVLRPVE